MTCCPTCGHPLPDPSEVKAVLTGTEYKIFEQIEKAGSRGARTQEILLGVYGSKAYDSSTHVVAVHVLRIRKKLAPLDLTITSKSGRYGRYTLAIQR